MTHAETEVGEISVYTNDEESFTTGTALVVARLRIDGRAACEPAGKRLTNALFDAMQPFAEISRPLHILENDRAGDDKLS